MLPTAYNYPPFAGLAPLVFAVACSFSGAPAPAGEIPDGGASPDASVDGNPIALADAATDAPIDAPVSTTLVFRDGPAYSGTRDTHVENDTPDDSFGTEVKFSWRRLGVAGPDSFRIGLLRFDDIVGGDASQIPSDALIESATLTIAVSTGGDPAVSGTVYPINVDWNESTTFRELAGPNGRLTPGDEFDNSIFWTAPNLEGPFNFDVTALVQSWVVEPQRNHGWLFFPRSALEVEVSTREHSVLNARPVLSVTLQR